MADICHLVVGEDILDAPIPASKLDLEVKFHGRRLTNWKGTLIMRSSDLLHRDEVCASHACTFPDLLQHCRIEGESSS